MNWPPRSRSEEIAAAAAKAYTSEKAANRCALEGLESKRALEAEQVAHAATRAELSRALAEKSKTAPTAEPTESLMYRMTMDPTSKPTSTAEPTSEPELTTEPI